MPTGAGRAPLIIAVVAALITYAVFGKQTPFGFLHGLHRHHDQVAANIHGDTIDDDTAQVARDSAQKIAAATQANIDSMQKGEEVARKAEDIAQRALDMAQAKADEAQARADEAQAKVDQAQASLEGAAVAGSAETRDLPAFDGIVLENDSDTAVTIGDTQSVSITAKDGGGEAIQTKVRDGKLIVAGSLSGAHIAIVVPHLRSLKVNGAGQVALEGLRDPISIETNGPVHISAAGSIDSAEVTLNGPSKVALTKLATKNMRIVLNGVADAEVNATDTLTADIHGIGHVRYVGEPHTVSHIHGLGSLERMHES